MPRFRDRIAKKVLKKKRDDSSSQNTAMAEGINLLYTSEYDKYTLDTMEDYLGVEISDEDAVLDDIDESFSFDEKAKAKAKSQEEYKDAPFVEGKLEASMRLEAAIASSRAKLRFLQSRQLMKESRDVVRDVRNHLKLIASLTPTRSDDEWVSSGKSKEIIENLQSDSSVRYYDMVDAVVQSMPGRGKIQSNYNRDLDMQF